jgi:hypothetical protein
VGDAASQIDLARITEVRTGLSGKRVHTDQAGIDGGQEYSPTTIGSWFPAGVEPRGHSPIHHSLGIL